jgi:hypothetical protein
MLPDRLYEALPYAYILIAVLGAVASDLSLYGLLFSGGLVAIAALIIAKRRAYRNLHAGWRGGRREV